MTARVTTPSFAGPRRRAFIRVSWQAAGEIALIAIAFFVYFGVRGLAVERVGEAEANAASLISFEQTLGIYHEALLQKPILHHGWLESLANGFYLYGHGPVIAAVALSLYARDRKGYLLMRNAFLLSGLIGIVFYIVLPVAPPRLMPGYGFEDTIQHEYHVRRVLMPHFLTDEYASVPSLHFGWNLLVGVALWRGFKQPGLRLLAVAMPVGMLLAIVSTANHYFLDAVIGAVVALAGWYLALALRDLGSRYRGAAPGRLADFRAWVAGDEVAEGAQAET